MGNFADLLTRWTGLGILGRDLGVPYDTVASWKRRNSIPAAYWPAIVLSAATRGIDGVDSQTLMEMGERSRGARRALQDTASDPKHVFVT